MRALTDLSLEKSVFHLSEREHLSLENPRVRQTILFAIASRSKLQILVGRLSVSEHLSSAQALVVEDIEARLKILDKGNLD